MNRELALPPNWHGIADGRNEILVRKVKFFGATELIARKWAAA
jgi:hypothetical protein